MKTNVVIVGAGFSGLLTAKLLAKRYGERVHVTLIDVKDRFEFQPRLVDLLQDRFQHVPFHGDLPAIAHRHGFEFVQGKATSIDRTARVVTVQTVSGAIKTYAYDYALYSVGAQTNFYNIPGAQEFAFDLKNFESLTRIRERVAQLVEKAQASSDVTERRKLLSFAVIGAGATGVESIFAIRIHVEKYMKTHAPELMKEATYTIVQAGPQILPGFPHSMVDGVAAELQRKSFSTLIGEPVSRVTEQGFETLHGRIIPAGLIIWSAGLRPQSNIEILPKPDCDPAGYVVTDGNLRIDDHLFAAGDCTTFKDKLMVVPKNGQTARRMAFTIADNIGAAITGKKPHRFTFFSKGTMLLTGWTGFIDMKLFVIKTRFTVQARDIFYGILYTELTK